MKKSWMIILTSLLIIFICIGVFIIKALYNPQSANVQASSKKYTGKNIVLSTGAPFITNLKDSGAILKTEIYIEVIDEQSQKVVEDNIPKVRDRIISILRDVTEKDINQQEIQENLKNMIKKDLQSTLKIDNITNIYFNEFVIQQ
ncbi:MAG: flagellar basal body-associated FliL family protein [Xylanivirga thermophila]|jgi:flagellar basal body-associated protein FliL|uniref:flagellar basal body-associated FliL family protein n=1 Tax=Xylanivirga thermophila TaxID=2496273 RepID=UPI00101DDC60|nr:flagellar basal body-associated FliL family protein [Xylanivirga thermophila]